MKIEVMSEFDSYLTVDARDLRRLIAENRITSFRRRDGWVKVDDGPLRGDGGDYGGPERREIRQFPLAEPNGVHFCCLPKQ